MITLPIPVCPPRPPKYTLTIAHCWCGYVCSATSEDSADAALFGHLVACHMIPEPEDDPRG